MRSPSWPSIRIASGLRVDCYVRSGVPAVVADSLDDIVERLHRLREAGRIANVGINPWPPDTTAGSSATPTRDALVTAFERWADQAGYTPVPAFRRETIPPSPLGLGPANPRERVESHW